MEKIKGIKNARFVGECVKSVNLRKECFIRSGSPSDVTDEDVNVLVDELQLKTIVDLRSDRELKLFGNDRGKLINRARKHGGASTLNYESFPKMITTMNYLKLIRSNLSWGEMGTIVPYSMLGVVKRSFWSVERGSMGIAMDAVGRGGLLGLYRAIWDYTPGSSESAKTGWDLCRVLRLCATAKRQPCLIHCTAGKDRTGVVCALLLAAVDVDRKEIVADYHASHVRLSRPFTNFQPTHVFMNASMVRLCLFALRDSNITRHDRHYSEIALDVCRENELIRRFRDHRNPC
eukprot:m.870570 g.870570  ORF g.870570 m.870570 type:complete len:290 (+) comp23567_c0_seq1:257-1126(+)